jgi:1-acyl-sn-glycerol-3-phosphate acyltransferase
MHTRTKVTPHETTATELLQVIQSLAAELRPDFMVQRITLDSRLDREVGLDSLARVELITRLEKHFNIALPEQVFSTAQTPRDLLRAVVMASGRATPTMASQVSDLALGEVQTVPYQAYTLLDVLDWHIQNHPNRTHIQLYSDKNEGDAITYARLKEYALGIATGLQQLGITPGDSVAIMLPTSQNYFYSFFGVLLAGAVPVPIYPPTSATQIEDHLRRHKNILTNCRAAVIITVSEAKRFAQWLKAQTLSLQRIITPEELRTIPGRYEKSIITAKSVAFLQYTSGSTGHPKGVVLTHANLLANIRIMGETVKASSRDVFVSWLPLYHDMGLIGTWLGSFYYSGLFVVMSPLEFLTRPQRWLWAIHRYRGTLSAAPNFGYELCLNRIDDQDIEGLDLGSWRIAFNGAESVSPASAQAFCDRFSRFGFRPEAMLPVYGLAEGTLGLAFPPINRGVLIDYVQRETFLRSGKAMPASIDDRNALRFVACGPPIPGHEIRIIDERGHELPEQQEGRLQFRGPSCTSGYLNNPEETRRLFDGDWLESGDLAYMKQGEVYITGRIKDIIIRAGRNLYPHELEEAVGDIAGIRKGRVAVFGAKDIKTGSEKLIIVAETREQDPNILAQLRTTINNIANDLTGSPPDDVVLAPPNSILKTSSGKIRRAASRELYEKGFIGTRHRAIWRQIWRLVMATLAPALRRSRRIVARGSYGIYASAMFWAVAPLVWLSVIASPVAAWRWRIMQIGARTLAWVTLTPVSMRGRENLPPQNQSCVFVANHASYLDGAVLVLALRRSFSFFAKAELAGQFVPGVFLRHIGAQFVERFNIDKGVADTQHATELARSGPQLVFFPEGTFTRVSGLRPFHMGAFLAAAQADVPIVPIAIRGTRSILRSDFRVPYHGRITVTFGDPIDPQVLKKQTNGSAWETALYLRDAAREHILRHCGEPDLE